MYTPALHLLYSSFRWGRWVIAGCYNESRYKNVENHCNKQNKKQKAIWKLLHLCVCHQRLQKHKTC